MLQNVPMVLDFAYKYVGNKNAFGFAKGLVKFANKVISESNKAITNAGNGTREVSLPEEAVQPPVDTNSGVGYNGNSESDFLDQAAGMERVSEGIIDSISIGNLSKFSDDEIYNLKNFGSIKTELNYTTTTGLELQGTTGKTTTIIGSFQQDMKYIVDELGNLKSVYFGPRNGGFNVLNVPDEEWEKLGADGFWEKYNKPWLQKAIKRKDIIKVATPPSDSVKYWYDVDGVKHLTGFGKEIELLENAGYYYDVKTSSYIKP